MPQPSFFREFQQSSTSNELVEKITSRWNAMGLEMSNRLEKLFLFTVAAFSLQKTYSSKTLPTTNQPSDLTSWVDFWISQGINLHILRATLPEILKVQLPAGSEQIFRGFPLQVDIFQEIYQQLFPHSTRFPKGEFFTPQVLADRIIEELNLQWYSDTYPRIIDPACGTGVFLISCYRMVLKSTLSENEKIMAFKNIIGFDINPFSVELAIINLLLLLSGTPYWAEPSFLNVQVKNTIHELLSQDSSSLLRMDVIIGNPPWGSLARLNEGDLREQMVIAAKLLDIQAPIQANNELAAIFMDLCVDSLLKPGGIIAMVLPRTILESSSLDKWRVLVPYQDIHVWIVDMSVFPIPGIVFFARKESFPRNSVEKFRIPVSKINESLGSGVGVSVQSLETGFWVPYHIDWDDSRTEIRRVRKWVPEELLSAPVQRSLYYDQAEKGANIGPITFISVLPLSPPEKNLVEFTPDVEGGKVPFNQPPYSSAIVEAQYIFPYVKSRTLIPFAIVRTQQCFLPVSITGDHLSRDNNLDKLANQHWKLLATQYATLRVVPSGKDLFSHYLNHKHHLESPKMLARLKVIFNEGGQRVKAALVRDGEIIEHTLVFIPVNSEEEGLYLTGILNSDYISEHFTGVGGRGSARHVSLRALEFPIPPYPSSNPECLAIQRAIVDAARSLENNARDLIKNTPKKIAPLTIEKRLRANFPGAWSQLNAAVITLLKK